MAYDPWKDVSDEDLFTRRSDAEFKLALASIIQAPIAAFIVKYADVPGMASLLAIFQRAVDTYAFLIEKYTSIIAALTAELKSRGLV